ncbi:MAG: sigma-70 family RNA polymerase sigma factor, partial [Verrucomicrobiae bacterium]|nr:sigma-70 family RNA polymerase sigma factor [Verrucomicrobiae bacterium]
MLSAGYEVRSYVERARRGDDAAVQFLIRRITPLVLKIVRAHLPRRTSEEDLVQTILMKVFTKLDQFSGSVPFEHWVSRVAVNTCINALHHERIRPEVRWADLSEEQEEVVKQLAGSDEELPSSHQVAARELVEKLLERLEPTDRMLVTLLYLEAVSYTHLTLPTS